MPSATTEVKTKKTYDPMPKGKYLMQLTRLTEKDTKAGNGTYLDATFQVVEGEFKNRLVFHKFHVANPNSKCQEVGIDQLNKFLKCSGAHGGLADLDFDTERVSEFINKPVAANVGIEEGSGGYKDRNRITSFQKR